MAPPRPELLPFSMLVCLLVVPLAHSAYDWHKEAEAVECCKSIPNTEYQPCSYASIEQDIEETIAYFADKKLDPAKLDEKARAELKKDYAEVLNDFPAMLAAEKCTTKGRDLTECCVRSGVAKKCAAATCNGTYNVEVEEKKSLDVAVEQFLTIAAECGGGQAKKVAECSLA